MSQSAVAVKASTTLAIDALYKKMRADGEDVVGFGAGEPDFDTPEPIKQAGIKAINDNLTRYTPASGLEKLRGAVCDRLRADCGVEYKISQVVVSSGAKHNIYIALRALLDPGDEVILPAPYWVSYYEQVKLCDGVPVEVFAPATAKFKITPQQLISAVTPKTKAIILNSPSNPTGMLYSKKELEAIAEVCIANGIYIISDEVYYKLVYDGAEFCSMAALSSEIYENTILVNGVSKSYAMTGWRIGYACAPQEIATVMANIQSHSTSAPATMSQMAAFEALTGPQDSVIEMRKAFESRRDFFMKRVNEIEGVSCVKPEGAFYIMMNMEKFIGCELYGVKITGSDDFAKLFLERGKVALVPCTGFGAPSFLRWSYATSMEAISTGLDRLDKFLSDGRK